MLAASTAFFVSPPASASSPGRPSAVPCGPGSASFPWLTGSIGFCPAYPLLGMSTCPMKKQA
jgi:hypothetical protein